ncbi:DNA polymerase III subunits gamma and tau [Aquipluma nitroreducens]|uniref:DNA polymerase III subunits gamma and tau n=1 Tax=Aquipluma nitroreducens TaxID=2010828 RepID=A0A5K7SDW8_9BACT|nr:hypothetical protein [Aquipluma nitroreducens]BBE19675.1 DNA polymerase III subunits gamma and tau [Aquipluma nitroreducens]
MVQQSATAGPSPQTQVSPTVGNLEPIEKPSAVKTIRRVGSSFTPSIKDALAGKVTEKSIIDEIAQTDYNEYENFSEQFTSEQLTAKWAEFLGLISDRPNLVSTLSNVPELTNGNKLLLKIGNSVQEEDVRQIKPELINFLRKELRNSGIELATSIEKIESERTHFNDSEKLQILMQKNPELFELKQKFNLDFNA